MDRAMFLHLSAFVLCAVSVAAYTPVCQPNTGKYSGPALPELPLFFSAKVEGNDFNRNYSFIVEEYFDNSTDQLAIGFTQEGNRSYVVMNYRKDERIVVDVLHRKCVISNASKVRFNNQRPTYDKQGHEHITTVSDFFHFGKKYNETFMGETTVRGIRAWHWQSCASHVNYSYTLDWYFSVPSWKTSGGNSPVPVRCVLNGTAIMNRTHQFHSFYQVFDFFDFIIGHPPPEKFQPPPGIYCAKREHGKTTPKLPKWFSCDLEVISLTRRTVTTMTTHYDMERKLARFDHQPRRSSEGAQRIVDIHDFNTGVAYSINSETGDCNMTSLNNSYDSMHDGDEDVHMKTPFQFIWHEKDSIRYQGVGVTREIETNVWMQNTTRRRPGKPHYYIREIHTSQPTWGTSAGQKRNQSEVPVFMRAWMNGKAVWVVNIYNFDGESTKLPLFDVGACFLWDKTERRIAVIDFDGDYKKLVEKQKTDFMNAIMDSISKQVGIGLLRMTGVKVFGYMDKFAVAVTILKRPTMEGVTVHMPHKEPELDEAFEKLKEIVEGGELKVTMPKQASPIVAKRFYESDIYDHKDPPIKPKKKGYKVSPVGVAIGSVLLGLFVGVLICFIVLKRRGVSLFSYQRQNNEI